MLLPLPRVFLPINLSKCMPLLDTVPSSNTLLLLIPLACAQNSDVALTIPMPPTHGSSPTDNPQHSTAVLLGKARHISYGATGLNTAYFVQAKQRDQNFPDFLFLW